MTVVLDASAAVELIRGGERKAQIQETLKTAARVLAPDLLEVELSNAFWKYHIIAGVPIDVCEAGIEEGVSVFDTLVPSRDLLKEAFHLSVSLKHPINDALYLVLARRESAVPATLDRKLQVIARSLSIRVLEFSA